MDFDGERLAVVDVLRSPDGNAWESCGFVLSVYDESGLLYLGEYESSLTVGGYHSSNYNFNCHLLSPFTVAWTS
jgi:hypothetical protein